MSLEDYRAEAERCSQCSYCKWIPFDQMKSVRFSRGCPSIAFHNFNSYSARGRYSLSLALLDGRIDYNDRVKDIAYQCQTCGNCDVSCKVCRYNLEPTDMIRELRAKLVSEGHTVARYDALIASLKKNGNMLVKPKSARGKWAAGLNVKNISSDKAKVLFFAGCRFSYEESQQSVARSAVSLLAGAGLDIGIAGADEVCCGQRAYATGYRQEFAETAEKNMDMWKKAGVKTVVTSCADCYQAFNRLYPKMGAQFEVLHTVEYLNRLIQNGKIKLSKKVPLKVTYHDPCNLGRQGEPYVPWQGQEKKIKNQIVVYTPRRPRYAGAKGVYEAPREVLKSIPGIELIEMERIKEAAWCCGAGGGVRDAYPEFSRWTAADRIEEAKATGAEAIVTTCGWCEKNFMDCIAGSGDHLKVLDIVELVSQAI